MKISVVIPVFNERETIHAIIARVREFTQDREIVIVDDRSIDGTREILQEIEAQSSDVKVLLHDLNLGKGAAVRTGFQAVSGDVVIVQDADLEYDPADYAKLLKPIEDGRADVVYGSRFAGNEAHRVLYFWHYLGNKFITLLSNACTNLNLTDVETCYKVLRREVVDALELQENRFGFDPEITAKVAKMRCRIYEVGISYSGRTFAEGKKISWRDGIPVVIAIVKYNLFR